jgi:hypothetical protein
VGHELKALLSVAKSAMLRFSARKPGSISQAMIILRSSTDFSEFEMVFLRWLKAARTILEK